MIRRIPSNLVHDGLSHAPPASNFNPMPVHLSQQQLPRRVNVANALHVHLQRNARPALVLFPATIQLLNPIARKLPLKLPNLARVHSLEGDFEHSNHCSSTIQHTIMKQVRSHPCRNESTDSNTLICNVLG